MGQPVSRLAQVARIASLGTQLKQQRPGLLRELSGKAVVFGCHQARLLGGRAAAGPGQITVS